MQFKNHFSKDSPGYQQYRPGYPPALFSYLASLCAVRQTAWDCATGTGQSALMLADHFKQVIATDASEAQIAHAMPKEGVRYRIASAEQSGIDSNVVDLITVAQALHWFDIDVFANEADRVLKDAGIIAVWTYNLVDITPQVNERVQMLYADIVGDYWPEERIMVENAYRDISLPFAELEAPRFEMSASWSLSQLIGYLCTWSATKRYQAAKRENPVAMIYDELTTAWGEKATRSVNWPLSMRIWRK